MDYVLRQEMGALGVVARSRSRMDFSGWTHFSACYTITDRYPGTLPNHSGWHWRSAADTSPPGHSLSPSGDEKRWRSVELRPKELSPELSSETWVSITHNMFGQPPPQYLTTCRKKSLAASSALQFRGAGMKAGGEEGSYTYNRREVLEFE